MVKLTRGPAFNFLIALSLISTSMPVAAGEFTPYLSCLEKLQSYSFGRGEDVAVCENRPMGKTTLAFAGHNASRVPGLWLYTENDAFFQPFPALDPPDSTLRTFPLELRLTDRSPIRAVYWGVVTNEFEAGTERHLSCDQFYDGQLAHPRVFKPRPLTLHEDRVSELRTLLRQRIASVGREYRKAYLLHYYPKQYLTDYKTDMQTQLSGLGVQLVTWQIEHGMGKPGYPPSRELALKALAACQALVTDDELVRSDLRTERSILQNMTVPAPQDNTTCN